MRKRVTDTSIESYHKQNFLPDQMRVLSLMGDGIARNALECQKELGFEQRSDAHARMNELEKKQFIRKLPDKVWCDKTERKVYAYQITTQGARWLAVLEGSDSA